MLKEARKKSDDPLQEDLRDKKAHWNEATKIFIKRLIALKKALNGIGDAKFGLPPSDIKNPIPNETVSFLNILAEDFEKLTNAADYLVKQQEDYSVKRRKPQEHMADDGLSAEASNLLSRFVSRLSSYFDSDEFSKARITLLNQFATLRRNVIDLQNAVVTLKVQSIVTAVDTQEMVSDQVSIISNTIENIKSNLPEEEPAIQPVKEVKENKQDKNLEIANQDEEIDKILKDLMFASKLSFPEREFVRSHILYIINKYKTQNKDFIQKNKLYIQVQQEYLEALGVCQKSYAIDPMFFRGQPTFKQIHDYVNKHNLQVKKANLFTRFLKKNLHKANIFDETSYLRLEIYDLSNDLRDLIDSIMNELESSPLNFEFVREKMREVVEINSKLDNKIAALNTFYRIFSEKKMRDEYSKNKKENIKDPFFSILNRKKKRNISKYFK